MGGRGASAGIGNGSLPKPIKVVKYSEFPAIEGTEKQVILAEKIRKEIARDIVSQFKMTESGSPTDAFTHMTDKESMKKWVTVNDPSFSKEINKQHTERRIQTVKYLANGYENYIKLMNNTSAKFWIDNRTDYVDNYRNKALRKKVFGK